MDTKSTNDVNTAPSSVKTITAVAQVVGALLTAYSGVLTAWQATHAGDLWPAVVLGVAGVLLITATHFGYVKGQVSSQNAIVAGLTAAATSPLVIDLIMGLVTKTKPAAAPPAPLLPTIPPVTAPSASLTSSAAPPTSPR